MVVATMVGTGVFVSLGYQAASLPSTFAILMLWVLGGVHALCGALCYAELAARIPRSGGEYVFLSRAFHPILGFLAGWVSVVVGFAAPVAVAALAFGAYLKAFLPGLAPASAGSALVLLCAGIHLGRGLLGKHFQNLFTGMKVALIVFFCLALLVLNHHPQPVHILPGPSDWSVLFGMDFAVAFVFVTYSYSGWNAAAYVSGELRHDPASVPIALLAGTGLVLLLYLALNFAFLRSIPFAELAALPDKERFATLAAENVFSDHGERLAHLLVLLGLVSSVGALTYVGPRISQTIGEDFPALSLLAHKNRHGAPVHALLVQLVLSLVFLFLADLRSLLVYAEFILLLFSFLTVSALFFLRRREPARQGFRVPLFPLPAILFLLMNLWVMVSIFDRHPIETTVGLLTIIAGFLLLPLTLLRKRNAL